MIDNGDKRYPRGIARSGQVLVSLGLWALILHLVL